MLKRMQQMTVSDIQNDHSAVNNIETYKTSIPQFSVEMMKRPGGKILITLQKLPY